MPNVCGKLKEFVIFLSFFYGILYGGLSPIPGISAGTLNIFLNKFEDSAEMISIAYIKKNPIGTVLFLGGWGFGLFWASNLIIRLLERHGQVTLFAAMGLIAGCIPMIFVKARGLAQEKRVFPQEKRLFTTVRNGILFALAFAFMMYLAISNAEQNPNRTIEQIGVITPAFLAALFAAGAVSSAAMLIPGVGGSLMMLVLGIYALFLEAVATLNPVLLAVLIGSMLCGILVGIKLIKKLLIWYSTALYSAILGFISGALIYLYPGFSAGVFAAVLSVVLAAGFAVLAFQLSRKG